MIQITPQMRIWLAVAPVDFRKGIDGLAALCRQQLKADPMAGALFVFTNKGRKSLRLLTYDGQGMWLCQKRFSQGACTGGRRAGISPFTRWILTNCNCSSGMATPWK